MWPTNCCGASKNREQKIQITGAATEKKKKKSTISSIISDKFGAIRPIVVRSK